MGFSDLLDWNLLPAEELQSGRIEEIWSHGLKLYAAFVRLWSSHLHRGSGGDARGALHSFGNPLLAPLTATTLRFFESRFKERDTERRDLFSPPPPFLFASLKVSLCL